MRSRPAQGAANNTFYIIKSGAAKVRQEKGTPRELAELGPGQFFGERALLKAEPASRAPRIERTGSHAPGHPAASRDQRPLQPPPRPRAGLGLDRRVERAGGVLLRP